MMILVSFRYDTEFENEREILDSARDFLQQTLR